MHASRKTVLVLALLTPGVLLFLSLDDQGGEGGGPRPYEALYKEESTGSRRNLSEAPAAARGTRGLELAEQGTRAQLPFASGQKRGSASASSGWIGDVYLRLSGNESFPDYQILKTLDLPQDQEGRQVLRTLKGQIRSFYRSQGFAQARVEASVAELNPMIVDVRIQEGRVVSYAGVEVEGANALSSQEVAAFYPASGGFVDWIRIREADLSVRQKYHDMGFAGVMISGRVLADDSSGLLRYRIRIVEGVQYRVGKVLLPGELASRFPLASGDLFRAGLLDEFAQENGLSEEQLRLDRDPAEGVVAITLVSGGGV